MPADLYGGNVVKPFLGRIVLRKLAGAGPLAAGAQVALAHAGASPRNPTNSTLLTGISGRDFPAGVVAGKRSPGVAITTVVRASADFTADLFNSLILSTDAGGDTDVWSILLDDLHTQEVWDGARCAGLQLRQTSRGGPVAMRLTFSCMYGESENPGTVYPITTFSPGVASAGPATDVTRVSFGGSADLVAGFSLDLKRPQTHVYYDDGTMFPAGVASGPLTGQVSITQSVKRSTAWADVGQVQFGGSGAGVALSFQLDLKEDVRDFQLENRMSVRSYQLLSRDGSPPITASAL
jgi:hypothetical protein